MRCPVELTAIYLAADGEIYSVRRRVSCETPAELAQGDCAVSVTARCAECGAGITQGGVELRASVDFELAAARRESFEQISAVTLTEEAEKAPRPSVTVAGFPRSCAPGRTTRSGASPSAAARQAR